MITLVNKKMIASKNSLYSGSSDELLEVAGMLARHVAMRRPPVRQSFKWDTLSQVDTVASDGESGGE